MKEYDQTELISGMITSAEDFDNFIEKEPEDQGYFCSICFSFRKRGKADVRNHVESKHFPNTFDYNCNVCGLTVGTNTALKRHMQRVHFIVNKISNQ